MQKHPGEEGGRAEDERVKRPPPPAWPSEQYQGGRRDNEQAQQDADEAKPGRIEVEVEEPVVRVEAAYGSFLSPANLATRFS